MGYESSNKSPQNHVLNVNELLQKGDAFISLQITSNLSNFPALYNQPVPTFDDYVIKHLNNFVTVYESNFPQRRLSLTFIDSNGVHKCVTQFLQPILPPESAYFPKNPKQRTESAISKSSGLSKSSSTKSFEYKKNVDVLSPRSVDKGSVYSGYGERFVKINDLEKLVCECSRYVALIPTYEIREQYNITLSGLVSLFIVYFLICNT